MRYSDEKAERREGSSCYTHSFIGSRHFDPDSSLWLDLPSSLDDRRLLTHSREV